VQKANAGFSKHLPFVIENKHHFFYKHLGDHLRVVYEILKLKIKLSNWSTSFDTKNCMVHFRFLRIIPLDKNIDKILEDYTIGNNRLNYRW